MRRALLLLLACLTAAASSTPTPPSCLAVSEQLASIHAHDTHTASLPYLGGVRAVFVSPEGIETVYLFLPEAAPWAREPNADVSIRCIAGTHAWVIYKRQWLNKLTGA